MSNFRIETERVFHHNGLFPDEPVDAQLRRAIEHHTMHRHRQKDHLLLWSLHVENQGDVETLIVETIRSQVNDPPVDGVCKIYNLGKAESGHPSNPGLNTALLDIFHIKVSSLEVDIVLPPKN